MSELPEIFAGPERLRAAFVAGLERMLDADQLGAFILVLANASFDPAIHPLLRDRLAARFAKLAAARRAALTQGRALVDAPDDLLVFLKLMAVGLDGLQTSRERRAGPWELQFNPLRAFRPARMTDVAVNDLQRPFDPAGFHFNKPFLRKEILWEGDLLGRPARLLYNKFPFMPLHGLLVPEPERQQPQFLTETAHRDAWRLAESLAECLPGSGIGYNSRGAYASVNHLHFQTYLRDAPLPIEDGQWRHNGGERDYPLAVECFTDSAAAWQWLADCHGDNAAYNLLYRPGRLYAMRRAMQGGYTHSEWTAGFAWAECCGVVSLPNAELFEGLSGDEVEAELARLVPASA